MPVNQWNDFLGFKASQDGTFYPAYRMGNEWLYFHIGDTDALYFCDNLTSCLMFLEATYEVVTTYIDLILASRIASSGITRL